MPKQAFEADVNVPLHNPFDGSNYATFRVVASAGGKLMAIYGAGDALLRDGAIRLTKEEAAALIEAITHARDQLAK